MKKQLLYTVQALLAAHLCTAQVLYSENFDNLAIGDLSTDPTGTTAGQGGWYVKAQSNNTSDVRIETEPGRGKVLFMEYPGNFYGANIADKRDLNIDWSQRIPSNEVLKIEYDFFTGSETLDSFPKNIMERVTFRITNNILGNNGGVVCLYQPYSSTFRVPGIPEDLLNKNSWVKLIIYIDYPDNKMHLVIPSLGIRKERIFVHNASMPVTIDNYLLEKLGVFVSDSGTLDSAYTRPFISKLDNIVVSAVNQVPLNIEEVLASKFNIFPNPVTDVVTITHNENIGIEEVTLYDMNGETAKLREDKTENEVQLDVSDLSSGMYLLHIKTKEGTAIKKVVKK